MGEASRQDTWISLGRGNRIDFAGELAAGGEGSGKDQVLVRDG